MATRSQSGPSPGRPAGQGWLDLLVVLLLFVAGLGARWLYVRAVTFPPLDDPAFYLTTGENLVSGRGLVVDALWSYHILFPGVTHPSHEHWMPLATGLIAAALALQRALAAGLEAGLPATLPVPQLPGLILGALLAPATYLFGRRALPTRPGARQRLWDTNRWLALGAALLVAVNATHSYQSASADSSAPFVLLSVLALSIAVRPPGEEGGYFGAGLLIGLAYLARADGLLLLLAVPLAWWLLPTPPRPVTDLPDKEAARIVWEYLPRQDGSEKEWQRAMAPGLTDLLDMGVAFVLVAFAWLLRNYLAFGTPLPGSLLSQAWLTDYIDTFNYAAHPTWETMLAQGWPALLALRGQALLHNGGVFLLSTFPWGLLALPGLWLLRREWLFFPATVYGLLLFFGLAIFFPVSSMWGTFYHSQAALLPFLAIAALYTIQRGLQRLVKRPKLAGTALAAILLGLLVLAGAQMAIALPTVQERHQVEAAQFQAVTDWLSQNAAEGDVIMTSQPYTLNQASGRPCIALPGNEPPDAAWDAARRYGARFLVITQAFGHYPEILHAGSGAADPRFRLLTVDEKEGAYRTEIYEIILDAEAPTG